MNATWVLWLCCLAASAFAGCHDSAEHGGKTADQKRCIGNAADCIRRDCKVNEHVYGNTCQPCPSGTTRPAGDNPNGRDTACRADFIDLCPQDPQKQEPGVCGCGLPDTDEDGDGNADCVGMRCAVEQHVSGGLCTDCPSGTTRPSGDDPTGGDTRCHDIDECADQTDTCHENAQCQNVQGGFECQCDAGFYGDGINCKPEIEHDDRWERAPDFTGLDFSNRLPRFPEYRIPTQDDCDWTIEAGVAVSAHGLEPVQEEFFVGAAYKASVAAGHPLPVTFCVIDSAGAAVFGGGYSRYSNRSVFIEAEEDVFLPLQAEFIGLTDTAEITISWDTKWGYVEYLGLYNIGLRGANDSFIIRANSGIGTLIMDGCWWLASRDYGPGEQHAGSKHASGMHIDKWDVLVWRRHKWRGEQPGTPGVDLREHSAYFKSSRGQTWILENDLRGGNRTGFQIRPEVGSNDEPVGPVVIAHNRSDGYGWNNGDTPETFDGGSAISVWTNPQGSTFIFRNEVTNAKYGCLMVGGQPPPKNWLNENGFPIRDVYVAENLLENRNGDRGAVSFTSVEDLHIYANDIDGIFTLNSQWGMRRHGIGNGRTQLYDPALADREIYTYDEGTDRARLMTVEEKQALLVED